MDFKIKILEDCVFFGSSFVKEEGFEQSMRWRWLVKEGAPALKGQTAALVQTQASKDKLTRLVDFLSFLSGAAAMGRCFAGLRGGPPVCGSSTLNSFYSRYAAGGSSEGEALEPAFLGKDGGEAFEAALKFFSRLQGASWAPRLAYWEERALSAAGVLTRPALPQKIFSSMEEARRGIAHAGGPAAELVCFSSARLSEMKRGEAFFPGSSMGLFGVLSPEQSRALSGFDFVFPLALQGFFPKARIAISSA